MKTGKVKVYNKRKGYGIITCESQDYFFRYDSIIGKSHRDCSVGEKVSFIPELHTRGLRAVQVQTV